MRESVKVGALLTATVLAGGVYFASSAVAGGGNAKTDRVAATNATSAAPRVFAVVSSSGAKIRGKAVASTAHIGTGVYDVRFLRDITKCAWTATIGDGSLPFGGSEPSSTIVASGRSGTNNGLFIQTFNSSGGATDLPFSVVVICS